MRAVILAALLVVAGPTSAMWCESCNVQPITPPGCDSDSGVCICDSVGNCHWQFNCEEEQE